MKLIFPNKQIEQQFGSQIAGLRPKRIEISPQELEFNNFYFLHYLQKLTHIPDCEIVIKT